MAKCEKCGTAWTTAGMTMCPICGSGVGEPAAEAKKTEILAAVGAAPKQNGTTVLKAAPRIVVEAAVPPSPAPPAPEPKPESPAMHLVDDTPLKVTMFPSSGPKTLEDESSGFAMPPTVDASAILSLHTPAAPKPMPAPARPLNGPLILGFLALVTGILLPLSMAFESHRVMGVLGFCLAGFFVPFAPAAWLAGLSAEKRRREQGLSPERQVVIGRLLGQWGTLLLIVEVTMSLILVAALRLSGSLPSTFWTLRQY